MVQQANHLYNHLAHLLVSLLIAQLANHLYNLVSVPLLRHLNRHQSLQGSHHANQQVHQPRSLVEYHHSNL